MASVNDSGMSLLEQAEELLRAGKRQAALPLLAEYLQGHPNSARGWWMLSLAVTDLRQQIDCMERVLVIDPNYGPAQARLDKLEQMLAPRPPAAVVPPFVTEEPSYRYEDTRSTPLFDDEEPQEQAQTFEEALEDEEPAYQWGSSSSTPWSSSYFDDDDQPRSASVPAPEPAPPTRAPEPPSRPTPKRGRIPKMPEWFLPVMVGLLLICLIVSCIGAVLLWRSFQPPTVSTPQPFVTVPPRTLEPTWTPTVTATPRATFTPIPGLTTAPGAQSTPAPQVALEGTSPGMLAPDFTLKDVDGRQARLSAYRGQPVLLFFWATWCPYCRTEITDLEKIHRAYEDSGLVVLAVEVGESAADGRAFRAEHDLSFSILSDSSQTVFRQYRGSAIPLNYFIDSDGRINYASTGMMDYSSLNLRARVLLNLVPTAAP